MSRLAGALVIIAAACLGTLADPSAQVGALLFTMGCFGMLVMLFGDAL